MEVTLKAGYNVYPGSLCRVSILVLMEVTLKGSFFSSAMTASLCFNPCFNGSDSKSRYKQLRLLPVHVSILVLMEVTLKETEMMRLEDYEMLFQSLF